MKVDGVSPQCQCNPPGVVRAREGRDRMDSPERVENEKHKDLKANNAEGQIPKGVLKHLQEGHYKGVAELRHRMKYFDRLQALESAKAQQATEEGVETLTKLAEEKIATLGSSGLLDPAQQESLGKLAEDFLKQVKDLGEKSTGSADLVSNLGQAFSAFDDALRNLLIPTDKTDPNVFTPVTVDPVQMGEPTEPVVHSEIPAGAEPVEMPPVSVDPAALVSETSAAAQVEVPTESLESSHPAPVTTEPLAVEPLVAQEPSSSAAPLSTATVGTSTVSPNLLTLLDDLKSSFSEGLSRLDQNLKSYSVLPELSQPQRHGGAYEKFLNLYKQMAGPASPSPDPEAAKQAV